MDQFSRGFVWSRIAEFGAEFATARVNATRLTAAGVAVGVGPKAYRLEYALETVTDFVTRRLDVRCEGVGWSRRLELERRPSGRWTCHAEAVGDAGLPPPGGGMGDVVGALDCDLGRSPLTNTMPVLRHRLHERPGRVDFVMAWVSAPDLSVRRSEQTYEFLRREGEARVVRYIGRHRDFVGELVFDREGFVVSYPGLAQREVAEAVPMT